MSITFPDTPTLNQSYTAENGLNYVWDGEKWKTLGSFAADTGAYILQDGSNTSVFADATSVGINTATPSETLEVSGGYILAGGGVKVQGGVAGTDGSIYRVDAAGTTGSYLIIEEQSAHVEIGHRTPNSYFGVNFAVTQTTPPVPDVHCANTYIQSSIQGTSNTYGFTLDVTDTITSDTALYGVRITGSWDTSTAPDNYGMFTDIDASVTGNANYQFAAHGTADSYFLGSVGIGTTSPADKLELGGAGAGIILASPNGTRYRITVADDGTVTSTAV